MKIDLIEFCGDCSHRFYNQNDLYCELTDKKTYENNSIPDWCPKIEADKNLINIYKTLIKKCFKKFDDKDNRISICCNAKVLINGSKEGTNYYICSKCNNPCDTILL